MMNGFSVHPQPTRRKDFFGATKARDKGAGGWIVTKTPMENVRKRGENHE